jgi:hypothetical protein
MSEHPDLARWALPYELVELLIAANVGCLALILVVEVGHLGLIVTDIRHLESEDRLVIPAVVGRLRGPYVPDLACPTISSNLLRSGIWDP